MSDNDSIDLNDSPRQTILDIEPSVKSEIPVIECDKSELDDLLITLEIISQINVGNNLLYVFFDNINLFYYLIVFVLNNRLNDLVDQCIYNDATFQLARSHSLLLFVN